MPLSHSCDVVASTVAELRPRIKELINSGVRDITINLSNAKMVDSMGIGLLIATYNSVTKMGGSYQWSQCYPMFRTV